MKLADFNLSPRAMAILMAARPAESEETRRKEKEEKLRRVHHCIKLRGDLSRRTKKKAEEDFNNNFTAVVHDALEKYFAKEVTNSHEA